jgi:hypothetical protein
METPEGQKEIKASEDVEDPVGLMTKLGVATPIQHSILKLKPEDIERLEKEDPKDKATLKTFALYDLVWEIIV